MQATTEIDTVLDQTANAINLTVDSPSGLLKASDVYKGLSVGRFSLARAENVGWVWPSGVSSFGLTLVFREIAPVTYAGICIFGQGGAGAVFDYSSAQMMEFDSSFPGRDFQAIVGIGNTGTGGPNNTFSIIGAKSVLAVWSYYQNNATGAWEVYRNGILAASGTASTLTFLDRFNGIMFGQRWLQGYVTSNAFQGDLCEAYFIARNVLPAERTINDAAMVLKWLYDDDAQAWITAVEAADALTMSTANKMNADALFKGLKADGIYSLISQIFLFKGPSTLAGALKAAKGTNLTSGAFVAGDHSRTVGLTGNGTSKYLSTGLNAMSVFSSNSQMMFATGSGFPTSGSDSILSGVFDGATAGSIANLDIYVGYLAGRAYRSGTGTAGQLPLITSGMITSGSLGAVKNGLTYAALFQNGLNVNTNTTSIASAPANIPLVIFGLNVNNVSIGSYFAGTLSTYACGPALTDAQMLLLHTRMTTYAANVT